MLTEEDLVRLERKMAQSTRSYENTEILLEGVFAEDVPALIATCRELLPLADALASGEADQYKAGWNAATDEAIRVVRAYNKLDAIETSLSILFSRKL